jgi:S-adenosylmethionine synthetase
MDYLTCESVSEGHPDKVCDQISDAILDAYLAVDPESRVAVECMITSKKLIIAGEVSSSATIDPVAVARRVLQQIGYMEEALGFDGLLGSIENLIQEQSREIGESVDRGGAGDQGTMYGYATSESWYYIPQPLMLAHLMMQKQAELRKNGTLPWLRPDAKAQVTMVYDEGWPDYVIQIVFSTQHEPEIDIGQLEREITRFIIHPILAKYSPKSSPRLLINPAGSFVKGDPQAGTGLTGRKIMVDTYGGIYPHGGGAFSGKDPSKVDRSAAYMARYIARHIIEANLAERCTVQLSYAIGLSQPLIFEIDTHQTGIMKDWLLSQKIKDLFDLTPAGIIRTLNLKKPIYEASATYGHFGRSQFPWEQINPALIQKMKAITI